MLIFLIIALIIILLLLYSIQLKYFFELENFDFSIRVIIKTPFEKEIVNNKKPKEKKIKEEPEKKEKRKLTLEDLKRLKEPCEMLIVRLFYHLKRKVKLAEIKTETKLALEDPMENGIAYGIVSGGLNMCSALLKSKLKVKNISLDVLSDFNSGEGFIFENCGTIKVRPLVLAISIITDIKLIKAVKEILNILKREEKKNG